MYIYIYMYVYARTHLTIELNSKYVDVRSSNGLQICSLSGEGRTFKAIV